MRGVMTCPFAMRVLYLRSTDTRITFDSSSAKFCPMQFLGPPPNGVYLCDILKIDEVRGDVEDKEGKEKGGWVSTLTSIHVHLPHPRISLV